MTWKSASVFTLLSELIHVIMSYVVKLPNAVSQVLVRVLSVVANTTLLAMCHSSAFL